MSEQLYKTRPITSPRSFEGDHTGFYIASSDHELLDQVSRLMNRQGVLGTMDTAGRMQYLIDGRRGSPLAARRIMDATQRLIRDQMLDPDELKPLRVLAVDEVLRRWQLSRRLKGYRFMRHILILASGNDSALRPISKTVYPAVAETFKVGHRQIERDIRYCLQTRPIPFVPVSNTTAICQMSDEVSVMVDQWARHIKLPVVADGDYGQS